MSGTAPITSQEATAPALWGVVSALAGGRRGTSNPRRPQARRRTQWRPSVGGSPLAARVAGSAPGAERDPSASAGGGRPSSDEPPRSDRKRAASHGDAPPLRTSPRTGTLAWARRRDLEAELIGLPAGPGGPAWWGPCWEDGLRADLSAELLFDALAAAHGDVRVLHGLGVGVRGAASSIDHVVIGAGGVVVVTTQSCTGRVRSDGVHLRVRGKDRSPTVDVALWQAEMVRASLERCGIRGIPVRGVLHWEHLESLGDKAICLRGVPLLSAGATVGLALAGTTVSPLIVGRVAEALAPAIAH